MDLGGIALFLLVRSYGETLTPDADGNRLGAQAAAPDAPTHLAVIFDHSEKTFRNQIYDQYKKAPDVTRERMYLETMERVLGGTDSGHLFVYNARTGRSRFEMCR